MFSPAVPIYLHFCVPPPGGAVTPRLAVVKTLFLSCAGDAKVLALTETSAANAREENEPVGQRLGGNNAQRRSLARRRKPISPATERLRQAEQRCYHRTAASAGCCCLLSRLKAGRMKSKLFTAECMTGECFLGPP